MDTSLHTDTIHGVQPTRISDYMLGAVQHPDFECPRASYRTGGCSVRFVKDSVDDESKLWGLDRLISKHEPAKPVEVPKPSKQTITAPVVDSFIPFEPLGTREKRPCNVLSGVSIDRFEFLPSNPQDLNHIVLNEPFRGGFQSRMSAKDTTVRKCGADLKL